MFSRGRVSTAYLTLFASLSCILIVSLAPGLLSISTVSLLFFCYNICLWRQASSERREATRQETGVCCHHKAAILPCNAWLSTTIGSSATNVSCLCNSAAVACLPFPFPFSSEPTLAAGPICTLSVCFISVVFSFLFSVAVERALGKVVSHFIFSSFILYSLFAKGRPH